MMFTGGVRWVIEHREGNAEAAAQQSPAAHAQPSNPASSSWPAPHAPPSFPWNPPVNHQPAHVHTDKHLRSHPQGQAFASSTAAPESGGDFLSPSGGGYKFHPSSVVSDLHHPFLDSHRGIMPSPVTAGPPHRQRQHLEVGSAFHDDMDWPASGTFPRRGDASDSWDSCLEGTDRHMRTIRSVPHAYQGVHPAGEAGAASSSVGSASRPVLEGGPWALSSLPLGDIPPLRHNHEGELKRSLDQVQHQDLAVGPTAHCAPLHDLSHSIAQSERQLPPSVNVNGQLQQPGWTGPLFVVAPWMRDWGGFQ